MKLTLEMIKRNGVEFDWKLLYVALNYNYIETKEIIKYAEKLIMDDKFLDNEFIMNLLINDVSDKNDILYGIKSNFIQDLNEDDEQWTLEKRILRYILLKNIIYENENENEKILKLVAEVYADFGYPIDMKEFIYYMPVQNNNSRNFSIEENRKRLISLLLKFLESEKLNIL